MLHPVVLILIHRNELGDNLLVFKSLTSAILILWCTTVTELFKCIYFFIYSTFQILIYSISSLRSALAILFSSKSKKSEEITYLWRSILFSMQIIFCSTISSFTALWLHRLQLPAEVWPTATAGILTSLKVGDGEKSLAIAHSVSYWIPSALLLNFPVICWISVNTASWWFLFLLVAGAPPPTMPNPVLAPTPSSSCLLANFWFSSPSIKKA